MASKSLLYLLIVAATTYAAPNGSITAVTWGAPVVDVFGIAPDNSVWHKYDRGTPDGWHPLQGLFEDMKGTALSHPVAVSWGANRIDYVHLGENNAAFHTYWDGTAWKPEHKGGEHLGGELSEDGSLAISSWGVNRLDIVGRGAKHNYYHKAWTGSEWYPGETDWLDLGGDFASAPAVVSWAPGRIDLVGIGKDGDIWHKYWNGDQWRPNVQRWESLGGGPFIGDPVLTSWGPNRFDIWAVAKNGSLMHKYWNGDGQTYSGWENLEGHFSTAPQVVHWDVDKIDIVGRNGTSYVSKAFDGSNWYPSFEGWFDKGGKFVTEPAVVVNRGTNFLYVMGVGDDDQLKMQIWDGGSWKPAGHRFWSLGDTSNPYGRESAFWVQEL